MFEQPAIGSKWRHVKRGTIYVIDKMCVIEATMETGVVYTATHDGTTWVRPASEFMDGRFVPVEA